MKIQANTPKNKVKRVEYLQRFLPYHREETKGSYEIVFIDESGFNLHNQGSDYAWYPKGLTPIREVPT